MSQRNLWFDEIYLKNSERLYKQAYYVLRDEHLAEDLVAEVFLILLYKQKALINHPNISGWLSVTLKNLIYDELKSSRYRLEIPLTSDNASSCTDTYHHSLDEALPKGLLPKEREILILLYQENLSYAEISQRLGISILNCRTRAFRAKARYKKLKEQEL